LRTSVLGELGSGNGPGFSVIDGVPGSSGETSDMETYLTAGKEGGV
jgi:hypothetical protein